MWTMNGYMETLNDIMHTAEAAQPQDYILKDGIKHCPICGKPMEIIREVLGQQRHLPIMCDCQREQERIIKEQAHLQALDDARRK